jgi:hypothetical protein
MADVDTSINPSDWRDVNTFGLLVERLQRDGTDVAARIELARAKAVDAANNSEIATAGHATLGKFIGELHERRQALQVTFETQSKTDFLDEAGDISAAAARFSAGQGELNYTAGKAQYLRERALPEAYLARLKTDYELASAAAAMSAWMTVQSGIERNKAAAELVEKEGVCVFSTTGKTYDMLVQTQRYLAMSGSAYKSYSEALRAHGGNR